MACEGNRTGKGLVEPIMRICTFCEGVIRNVLISYVYSGADVATWDKYFFDKEDVDETKLIRMYYYKK